MSAGALAWTAATEHAASAGGLPCWGRTRASSATTDSPNTIPAVGILIVSPHSRIGRSSGGRRRAPSPPACECADVLYRPAGPCRFAARPCNRIAPDVYSRPLEEAAYLADHADHDRPPRRSARRLVHQHVRRRDGGLLRQHHPAVQPDFHPDDPDADRAAAVRHAGRRHRGSGPLQGRRPHGPAGDHLLRGRHDAGALHRARGRQYPETRRWRGAAGNVGRARRRDRRHKRGTRSCCTWCRPRSSRRCRPATSCRSSCSASCSRSDSAWSARRAGR